MSYNSKAILDQVKTIKADLASNQRRGQDLELLIATANKNLIGSKDKQHDYDNLQLACKLILEKLTIENKTKLEQFSTYALQSIFTDKDYSIELEIKEDTKNPSITILLVDNEVKQDVRGSVGGGIITVLGFLFQIYYLEVYGLNKIMFIDEGLKEVSKAGLENDNVDYLANLLLFLQELSKERKYKFITVTHDDSVRLIADKVYRVRNGEVRELEHKVSENVDNF